MFNLLRNALAVVGGFYVYRLLTGRSDGLRLTKDDGVYKVVEELPLYGLNASAYPLPEYSAAKKAADERMLDFIHTHLEYPDRARKERKEGTAVVSFIVRPNGHGDTPRIVRDPGADLGQAAIVVVDKLLKEGERWRPGYHRGEAVPTQFLLPIQFKINKLDEPS